MVKNRKEIFELISTKDVPKLMTDTKPHVQKGLRTSYRISTKKSTPKHIIFKLKSKKTKRLEKKRTEYPRT